MMAPSGGKGGRGASPSFQAYQDFSSFEDDTHAVGGNVYGVGSGYGGMRLVTFVYWQIRKSFGKGRQWQFRNYFARRKGKKKIYIKTERLL